MSVNFPVSKCALKSHLSESENKKQIGWNLLTPVTKLIILWSVVVACWSVPSTFHPLAILLPLSTMGLGIGIFVFTVRWISDLKHILRRKDDPIADIEHLL